MKFNKSFSGEDFDNYRKYLETVRDKFPAPLYDFVSDSKRHDLEEQSLHDSWINAIEIKSIRDKDNRSREKELVIKIELLGPFHDRIFDLNFNDVLAYQIGTDRLGQCDLITYEIYYENIDDETGALVFNAEFMDESEISIKAREITILEKFI